MSSVHNLTRQNLPLLRSSIIRWSTIVSALAITEASLLAQALKANPELISETIVPAPIAAAPVPTVPVNITIPPSTVVEAAPQLSGARITLRGKPAMYVSVDFSKAETEIALEQLKTLAPRQGIEDIYIVGRPETHAMRDLMRNKIATARLVSSHKIHLQKMTHDFETLTGVVFVMRPSL